MKKIHLDTDIGGDMDDLCALAMLLKWPDLDITGVTTVSEESGRRAGYVSYVLNLMQRTDIMYAAGADVASGFYRYKLDYPPEEENWPEPIAPQPGSPDQAVALLKRSIEQGAIIVATGPLTNLMLLEKQYPGILSQSTLFLMGGYVFDIPDGYPQWDKKDDYNIQVDMDSARFVLEHANPTLVPISVTESDSLETGVPSKTGSGWSLRPTHRASSRCVCEESPLRTTVWRNLFRTPQ